MAGPALPPELTPLTAEDPATIGPFHVVGRLGAGGMGAVYGALDGTGRCVAVKVIHPHLAGDPEYRARFAHEVELVRGIDAECAPPFLGADAAADPPWLATEFVPGRTLSKHVKEFGPLQGAELLLFAAGTAEAIAAIHAGGVMHRDIKPGNVMLSPEGPKVLDFGIARAVDEATAEQQVSGTPGYLAPERLDGRPSTPAGDVFAWAGMVVFAATGHGPFSATTTEQVLARLRAGDHDLSGVPDALLPLVQAALSPAPELRPSAADCYSAVLDLLLPDDIAEDEPAGMEVPAPAGDAGADPRRRRLRQALASSWRGFDSAGHSPGAWAAAGGVGAGTASAIGAAAAQAAPAAKSGLAAVLLGSKTAVAVTTATTVAAVGAVGTGGYFAAEAVVSSGVVGEGEAEVQQQADQGEEEADEQQPPYDAQQVEFRGMTLPVPADWGVYRLEGEFSGFETGVTAEEYVVVEPGGGCGEGAAWHWSGNTTPECPHILLLGPAGIQYGGPTFQPYTPDDVFAPAMEPQPCPDGGRLHSQPPDGAGNQLTAEQAAVGDREALLREYTTVCMNMTDIVTEAYDQRTWYLESEEILIVDHWMNEEFPETLQYAQW